jgi:hypothetical protein
MLHLRSRARGGRGLRPEAMRAALVRADKSACLRSTGRVAAELNWATAQSTARKMLLVATIVGAEGYAVEAGLVCRKSGRRIVELGMQEAETERKEKKRSVGEFLVRSVLISPCCNISKKFTELRFIR